MPEENILVIPRSLLDGLGSFQGIQTDIASYLPRMLAQGANHFMPRSKAEEDPSHKQIIPYCVLTFEGKILRYFRGSGSGEKRLVAKGSIGVGGHINDGDEGFFSMDDEIYTRAVEREINEELRLGGGFRDEMVALLNDDSNPVGQVHLGVVHILTLESGDVRPGEKVLRDMAFLTVEELRQEREGLETWSQIVLDHWEELSAIPADGSV